MRQTYIDTARALRERLHAVPELAFHETETKRVLLDFLRRETDLTVIDRGEWFCAVCEAGGTPIALRADFDAVAGADGAPGHFCGHDGHAAALAAFGKYLSENRPPRTVWLVFQPAEEIGAGAALCAPFLAEKGIREVYGWHNIPGHAMGHILLTEGTFACASTGLEITLRGKPSHAAYPEDGVNPARCAAGLVERMHELLARPHRGMVLGTVIGIELGSAAYGVSASEGVVRLTLRAEYGDEFEAFVSEMKRAAETGAAAEGLICGIREIERFAATENTPECARKLERAARAADLPAEWLKTPFRWSEDFGTFLTACPGAFFGIGDGEDWPQLHTDGYHFPDWIFPAALKMLRQIVTMETV